MKIAEYLQTLTFVLILLFIGLSACDFEGDGKDVVIIGLLCIVYGISRIIKEDLKQ